MRRVLHIIAPVSFGGGESLLATLTKEKTPGTHESVLTLYASPRFENALTSNNIDIYRFSDTEISHGVSKWENGKAFIKNLVRIDKIVRTLNRLNPDIIHAHGFPANVVALIALTTGRASIIYTHHSYKPKLNSFESLVMGALYGMFSQCTSVSNAACHAANKAIKKSNLFRTVYNCIDWKFYEHADIPSPPSDCINFIYIARFIGCKNHLLLPAAASKAYNEYGLNVRIHLVGDGELRGELESLIKQYGVEDQFVLHGAVNHEDLPRLIGQCDFGLFPAKIEGFGIAVVECLAQGLPVLSLDNELMEEIVGSAGVRVQKEELAEGFLSIVKNDRNLRIAAIEQAKKFAPQEIKQQYLRLYNALRAPCTI